MKRLLIVLLALPLATQLAAGRWIWGSSFGGPGMERVWDIAADAAGNLMVTGEFTEYLLIGGLNIPSLGLVDSFVAKFDPQGILLWCHALGSLNETAGLGVGADAQGNCYVGGFFNGTLHCQGDSLVSQGIGDAYVAKFDPAGSLLWLRSFGGPANDLVHGLSVNDGGQVFVAGWFADTLSFAPGQSLVSSGGSDIFTASFSSAGEPLWARPGSSPGVDYGYKIACDDQGNSYTTGVATNGCDFSGLSFPGSGVFVAKYNSQGVPQWLLPATNAMVISISCQREAAGTPWGAVAGRLTGAGSFGNFSFDTVEGSSDYYWARFDALSGQWIELQVHGGAGDDRGRDCHCAQNLAVVGTLSGSASFMGQTYLSQGADDIAIYDELSGVITAGGAYAEVPYAICRAPNGCLAISGWHWGQFELSCGLIDSGSEFNQNAFIAVYNPAAAAEEYLQPPSALLCHPNPFSCVIKVKTGQPGPHTLKVFNLKGQLLCRRTISDPDMCFWDGRDAAGREQGPGIYILELNGRRAKALKLGR